MSKIKLFLAGFGFFLLMIGACALDSNQIISVIIMILGGILLSPYIAEESRIQKRGRR